MQSLKRKVADLLEELESALSGPASSASADDSAAATALNAALAADEDAMPPPPVATASPFSLGSGSPFAMGSSARSPTQPLSIAFDMVSAGAPAGSAPGSRRPSSAGARKLETMAELEALLGASEASAKPPACRPHSRDDYHGRVRTFRSARGWFDKPDAVGPLVCARYGWCLDATTPDVLVCSVCAARVKSPAMLHEKEAVDALAAELQAGHRDLCPWLGNPSPEAFGSRLLPSPPGSGAHPSLVEGAPQAAEALRQRVAGLLRMPYLPALAPSLEQSLDECARAAGVSGGAVALLHAVTERTRQAGGSGGSSAGGGAGVVGGRAPDSTAARRHDTALSLALLGWRQGAAVIPVGGAEPHPTLECVEDGRTLGLWHYQRLEVGAAPTPVTTAGARPAGWKRAWVEPNANVGAGASALPLLDPIGEHRPWSPWVAVTRGDSMPAWMRCTGLILPPGAGGGAASVSAALALL